MKGREEGRKEAGKQTLVILANMKAKQHGVTQKWLSPARPLVTQPFSFEYSVWLSQHPLLCLCI